MEPVAASSSSSAKQTSSYELPWVEKYRPQILDDVVGNEPVIDRLRVIAQYGNMPHILLAGPPGCGKTTAVMALAKQTLGNQLKNAVLELNASDERGIDTVRSKIKMFAQKKVTLPPGRHKIVLLDEADSMTSAAQQALRRTMELHSSTTRFALACNLSSKIIEPIQSRCAVVRFQRLSPSQISQRLKFVLEQENVQYDASGIEAAVFTADGDMRIALNNVQSTYNGFGFVNAKNLNKVCDQPHPKVAAEFISLCMEKDINNAMAKVMFLFDQGYSAIDIIQTIFRVTRNMDIPDELQKLNFLRQIGQIHMRMAQGVATPLQLAGLASALCST